MPREPIRKSLAILVTGTRRVNPAARGLVRSTLDSLKPRLPKYKRVLLIHGDAAGVDTLADQWAEQCGVPTIPMPAQWDRDSKAAGPLRNVCMLNTLIQLRTCGWRTMVIAFPSSGSIGTRHMIRISEAAKFEVVVVDLHDP